MLDQFNFEIPRLTRDVLDFTESSQLDVQMPADLDQFGRDDSHRAVAGGEGLVQLGHDPPDGRAFFRPDRRNNPSRPDPALPACRRSHRRRPLPNRWTSFGIPFVSSTDGVTSYRPAPDLSPTTRSGSDAAFRGISSAVDKLYASKKIFYPNPLRLSIETGAAGGCGLDSGLI